ncbi:division/cell wall cluster transcriptional repressor MraZ [Roseibium salinum]|nr:division/cell wall cluster transcriptional repressor MraZ [Roseibium salinum]
MTISDMIRDHAGITDQVTFVGMKYKFQIWEPEKVPRVPRRGPKARARVAVGASPPAPSPGEPV